MRIATWNINGLLSSSHEVEYFLKLNKIDVLLISEAHVTKQTSYQLEGYCTYLTPHPDGKSHAGSAVIIKQNIKHNLLDPYQEDHLQATCISLTDKSDSITLAAVYCPPKHKITETMFNKFFQTLGKRFIAGGDWNSKHVYWGSRITLTRGRELKKSMDLNRLIPLSTGEPTYWPTDPKKIPDLLDFFVTKGIGYLYTKAEPSFDGSFDHLLS